MLVRLNQPKVVRLWWPIRVFQQDLISPNHGKLVTLGFGKKCVVTVRQGGLNGSLPTVMYSELGHYVKQWKHSVLELIDTHMIKTLVIEDMSTSRKDQMIEGLLNKHGIQSKPVDVFNKFRKEIAELQEGMDSIDND